MTGFISINRIRSFFMKVAEDNKRKIIEGLNNFQTVGGNKKGFSGLVLLVSITKEKCYRDLDVLTRHYNKS